MEEQGRFKIIRKDLVQMVDAIVLEAKALSIGRLTTNDLVLNHRTVSRLHAGITRQDGSYWFTNLSRSNGTLINGKLVGNIHFQLIKKNLIQLGYYTLQTIESGDGLEITVELMIGTPKTESLTVGASET